MAVFELKQNVEKVIIDRIEGETAVAEKGGVMAEIPLYELPAGVKEGSVLKLQNGEYVLDSAAEEKRKKDLFAKQRSLFGK